MAPRLPSRVARPSATSSASEAGFTLIEVLVALAAGLVLTLAVLVVQLRSSTQNMRINDINQRDNELRAAVDMLSQDVGAAGFLLTPGVTTCSARLNYDSAAPSPGYFATFPIAAFAASSGQTMPFVTSASTTASGLTMDYPASGSGNRSDVLVISRAADATQFVDAVTPTTNAGSNSAFHPMNDGRLPLATNYRVTAGDMTLVMVPVAGRRLCLRVPATSLGTASSSAYMASSGTLMPSNFYTGLSNNLSATGFANGSLSDNLLMQSKIMDLGTAANSNQLSYVYYVSSPAGSWPSLMRATVNAMNDTVVGTPQPIAAGVVSLQVLFGVDTSGSGAVTAYQTGATVASGNNYANIRSVRIGLIVRSLYADPTYTAPTTLSIPGTAAGVPFSTYTVQAVNNRHTAVVTEIALRNQLWAN